MVYESFVVWQGQGFGPQVFFPLMLTLAVLGVAAFVLHHFLRDFPTIAVGQATIRFGDEVFRLSEIEEAKLVGKVPLGWWGGPRVEGVALRFRGGTERFIRDDMYSNTWELKEFLAQVVSGEGSVHPVVETISTKTSPLRGAAEFKGNQLASFWGLMLWGVTCFFFLLVLLLEPRPTALWIFPPVFGAVWFLICSHAMHFFSLEGKRFAVRNHTLFWRRRAFGLDYVVEVVFERPSFRSPIWLRVITKDYKNWVYPAATLSDETWLRLRQALTESGIPVRNECVISRETQMGFSVF